MRKTLLLVLAGMVGTLLVNTSAVAQRLITEELDSIVAIVEDDVILRSELDSSIATITQQIQAGGGQVPSRGALEKQVMERLVLVELQLQRAEASGIRVSDTEVDESLRRLAQSNGITLTQLRQSLEADGFSYAQFRREMRDEMVTTRLRQRVAASRVEVSETEIDIYLGSQQVDQGEYRISHILIGLPEGATPDQIQQGRDKAMRVYEELEAGLDFATAAVNYSDGQQALEGGDLGWRPANQVPTIFADTIAGMRAGDLARPLRSPSGFHILKVADFRERSQHMVEEYHARHIMVEINELVTSTEALEIVQNVHERVVNGESFDELAKQYSDDNTTANLGGDMGWFQPEAYGPRIGQILASLQEGMLSQPFQTSAGWHILEKLGSREQDRTEAVIRAQARENIRLRKAEEEVELWLRELRDEAYIDMRV